MSNVFKFKLFFCIMIEILAFLGLIFGIFVVNIAREELYSGKKYFDFIEVILLSILVISILLFNFRYSVFIGFIIGFLLYFILRNIYFYFGLLLSVNVFLNKDLLLFYVFIVFLFGLFYSRRFVNLKRNDFNKDIFLTFILFLIPFILIFAKDFILNYDIFLNGICLGAFSHVIGRYYTRH